MMNATNMLLTLLIGNLMLVNATLQGIAGHDGMMVFFSIVGALVCIVAVLGFISAVGYKERNQE